MPIYEYKCLSCESHVEKMQKVSDAPLSVCESCGGKLEKQLSLSGFQFKGAGWYVTEYSGKSGGKETEKTEKTEKNSAPDSTAETETASKKTNDGVATNTKKETSPAKE